MSYEGTTCPCGDKKQANTMLCTSCMDAFANHPSMAVFQNTNGDREQRRHAAMILLELARSRKNNPRKSVTSA